MSDDYTYWYCPDCGVKGVERGGPADYDTLHHIGFDHRADGNKCVGMHIRAGGENVWPAVSGRVADHEHTQETG